MRVCWLWLLVLVPVCAQFRDEAPQRALTFTLRNGATAEKHLIESMPGGIAVFDYDNDGWMDVFFTNGAEIKGLRKSGPEYWNRLFRNIEGKRFEDVTERAGVAGKGFSMGAAAADLNNDGHVDLFVAGVKQYLLYRNRGDGTFEDVSEKVRIPGPEWGVAGAFVDDNGDGLLDLFVVNYGEWDPSKETYCGDPAKGLRIYCHPRLYKPRPNYLLRNQGMTGFAAIPFANHAGRGMSVAVLDYDRDGKPDLFVTNDAMPNFLFRNLGKGKFEEVGLQAGVALMDSGKPVSSMGVDARDINNDGRSELFITALTHETFPLFASAQEGFVDATQRSGMAQMSARFSGWGVGVLDVDNDGTFSLFTANSHVNDRIQELEASPYLQKNTLFRLSAAGKVTGVTELGEARAHRGAAFADFNNDGLVDVVTSSIDGAAELWINQSQAGNHWVAVKLQGSKSNRDGIGARVTVNGQVREFTTAQSYASSAHVPLHFGLGKGNKAQVKVEWPSGKVQTLEIADVDRVVVIKEP